MFSIFKKKPKREGACAVEITPSGIAFAYVANQKHRPVVGVACGFQLCENQQFSAKCLAEIVVDNNLQHLDCNLVLHPANYRLFLIDAPRVPVEEYKSAVRWQIKDMVDFPLEDIVADVFLPTQDPAERHKKIYVIAAQKSLLQQTIDLLYKSLLNPVAIDIHELAIRNLLAATAQEGILRAFLHIMAKKSVLLIVKDNAVYFARRIKHGREDLSDQQAVAGFVAEIGRCFDYYHHQLQQETPAQLLLVPLSVPQQELLPACDAAFNLDVQYINTNDIVSFPQLLSDELQSYCCGAIGGVLKEG